MRDEIVPVVDEKDNIIGYKKKSEMTKKDSYRIASLWLENSKGQVLIAQRSFSMEHNPGKWSHSVAGGVAKDETYETTILREAFEEIGLRDINVEFSEKLRVKTHDNYIFCQTFRAKIDRTLSEFVIDKNEVAGLKWVDKNDLKKEIQNNSEQFTPSFLEAVKIFIK